MGAPWSSGRAGLSGPHRSIPVALKPVPEGVRPRMAAQKGSLERTFHVKHGPTGELQNASDNAPLSRE